MGEIRSNGLSITRIARTPADGGMAADADLKQLGVTYKDSAGLTDSDPTTDDILSEENSDPEEQFVTSGKTIGKHSLINYDPAVLVTLKGGVASVDSNFRPVWEAPDEDTGGEFSLEFVNKRGMVTQIPRAKVFAKINMAMKKNGIDLIDLTYTILKPTKAGVKRMKFIHPAPPVPVITQQPTGAGAYKVGDAIVLSVAGTGYKSLNWWKNNSSINIHTPTLTIAAGQLSDAGTYKVYFIGDGAPAISQEVVVTVTV